MSVQTAHAWCLDNNDLATHQRQALACDVAAVQATQTAITTATRNQFDHTRVLGIMTAARGAEAFLPYTIPILLRQSARAGRGADMVIGLNNGYACDDIIQVFQAMAGVEIIQLYTADKLGPDQPAIIHRTPAADTPPYVVPAHTDPQRPHRIFVVHQKPGPFAAGKIRMLADIVHSLVLDSVQRGWVLPAHTVLFDAESVFMVQQSTMLEELQTIRQLYMQTHGAIDQIVTALIGVWMHTQNPADLLSAHLPDSLDVPGLETLLAELDADPDLDILGTALRLCPFNDPRDVQGLPTRLPNFHTPIAPIQLLMNYVHGLTPEFQTLTGGGTVGRSDRLLSLIAVVSKHHANIRSEDGMNTVLAHHVGFRTRVTRQVCSTNRCFEANEVAPGTPARAAWKMQQARWYAGIHVLENLYGREQVNMILSELAPSRYLFLALAVFARRLRETGDVAESLALLQQLQQLHDDHNEAQHIARQHPDIIAGPHANPSW